MIPMQRFGTAEEVASIVTFLCAEKHMYIHGQVIGAMAAWLFNERFVFHGKI